MSHAEKVRQVVRRLGRRHRNTPPQGLHHQKSRAQIPDQAARRRRRKKSPGVGTAREVLEAFAEALPRNYHAAIVAKELARLVGQVPTHHLTPLHLHTLVGRWRSAYTRNTTYGRTQALRRVIRWYEQATGVHGLSAETPHVPGPTQRHVVATADELERLHRAADPFMRVWLRLTVALALGQHEARSLGPLHYNAEKRTVSFTRKKTGQHQTLPVPDDLAEIFEAAPDFGDPSTPFLERYNHGKPLTAQTISTRWWRLKTLAGVRREVTPHDLRRTTATALYTLTKDLRVVQQLLGHASMQPTVRYVAHADAAALKPLLAQLWKPQTERKQ